MSVEARLLERIAQELSVDELVELLELEPEDVVKAFGERLSLSHVRRRVLEALD